MTKQEHIQKAENLLDRAEHARSQRRSSDDWAAALLGITALLAEAQVHATLAITAEEY
jgi:hypothetical protein